MTTEVVLTLSTELLPFIDSSDADENVTSLAMKHEINNKVKDKITFNIFNGQYLTFKHTIFITWMEKAKNGM